jgi:hypothetical protein
MNSVKNVNYFVVDQSTAEGYAGEDFFDRLVEEEAKGTHGFFKSAGKEMMYIPYEGIYTPKHKFQLFALASGKDLWPVVIDKETGIEGVTVEEGEQLGGITYILCEKKTRSIVALSQSGPGATAIQDFARQLTTVSSTRVNPIGIKFLTKKVLEWQRYTKVTIGFAVGNSDDAFDTLEKDVFGRNYGLLRYLDGAVMEQTIASGSGENRTLETENTRSLIQHLLENMKGLRKLVITGKASVDAPAQTHDLCQPRLKLSVDVSVSGRYIRPDEAKSALFEAWQEKLEHIEDAADDYVVDAEEEEDTAHDGKEAAAGVGN